jgi:hypothetical protein
MTWDAIGTIGELVGDAAVVFSFVHPRSPARFATTSKRIFSSNHDVGSLRARETLIRLET